MKTINVTFKCEHETCPFPTHQQCLDSNTLHEEYPQICPYLNAYLTPQQPPQPCTHTRHTCNECKNDHLTDYIYCQSPQKR